MAAVKMIIIAAILTVVTCEPPASYNYQPPGNTNALNNGYLPPNTGYGTPTDYNPPSFSSGPGHHHSHGHDENQVPKSYEFGYSVKDALSGNDYGRRESSDGNVVRGEYRVQLPDGRTQIVTYHADWQTGFHADVRYVGEARYPETLPNYNRGGNTGYNYEAPTDFTGSLTGFHGTGRAPSPVYGYH
ncbi:pro-resilin-like [Bombyx mandarina]|uniref:Pro-resilin-like n=1 Tax=Bombyx mandarina TaxID=7092 RepID=A0A6J2KAJ1_BOMMA|nr:pro-resilin-like [Bombyx mandarina]